MEMPRRTGKKILIFFITALLLVSIHPRVVEASTLPDYIRVGLVYGATAVATYTVSSEAGFLLGNTTENGFASTLPLPAYGSLVVSVENGHIAVRDPNGVLISADIGIAGGLAASNYESGGFTTTTSGKYRGYFTFSANSNGTFSVINVLSMDEYLYGVVHKEMSQNNPIEALKAQAVAARSFAYDSIGRHENDGFDVCTSTHCQVYDGFEAEYPSTIRAVDETSGLILWNQGNAVAAYYHKNSGGHTQSIEDVWSSYSPYLIGVTDPYSPDYPWTATIYFDSLQQKLTQAGLDPGTIQSVKVGERNSSGAVSKLMISGSKTTVSLDKERIRSVLGTSLIRSRLFSLGEMGEPTAANLTVDFSISNGSRAVEKQNSTYVLSGNGVKQKMNTPDLYMSNGTNTIKPKVTNLANSGYDDSYIAMDGKVVFTGKGYGHGVGMSQDGAIQMGKEGFTFYEILSFYYTDIEVR